MSTLALGGDVMLGRFVDVTLNERGPRYVWGDVLPLLHSVDLRLVNLECALTRHAGRWGEKAFYFRADPNNGVAALQLAKIDCVALANNHVLDYGEAGLRETIRVLDDAAIARAGAGEDERQARAPTLLAARDARVAVVSFADHPAEWAAGARTPGINYVRLENGVAQVRETLAAARAEADIVVASFHWGPNMRARPSEAFRAFARAVVDAGADVFWGHSAHVVQGVELRGGRVILYDAGDLLDDYAVDADLRNDRSALFLVRLRGRVIERVEIVPVRIHEEQVNLAVGEDREWFASRFRELCRELGTAATDEADRLVVTVSGTRSALSPS